MVNLEAEFEQYKILHKYVILKAKLIEYFKVIEFNKVNLPDFMRDYKPTDKADVEIRRLLCLPDGGAKFNQLYELAYQELAEVLD